MKRIFRYACVQAITLVMACTMMHGQQYDKNWLIGDDNGTPPFKLSVLILNTTSFTVDTLTRILSMGNSFTCVSDSTGVLQFYSNGDAIGDKKNNIMYGSSGFNAGYQSTVETFGFGQHDQLIAVPKPGDIAKYGIFHTVYDTVKLKGFYYTQAKSIHLYYSEIDMSLNSGKGEMVKKNDAVINDTIITGLLAACKHGNGRDWWVITHRVFSNKYYKVLFAPNKTKIADTQVITGDLDSSDFIGQAVFSPDGAHYAIATQDNRVRLFDFNRCTGELSNYKWDTIPKLPSQITYDYIRGCSFSPNSNFLYVNIGEHIYQYDLSDTSFRKSRMEVAKWAYYKKPFETYFGENRLAPNGKIYISTSNGTWVIHVIDSPDIRGTGCHILQNYVHIDTIGGCHGLPNFPNYRLGALKGSLCDTITGLNEIFEKMHPVKVFPNPAANKCVLEYQLPQNVPGLLTIYNVLGEVVFEQGLPQWSIMQQLDIGKLPQGVYLIRISGGGQAACVRFFKE